MKQPLKNLVSFFSILLPVLIVCLLGGNWFWLKNQIDQFETATLTELAKKQQSISYEDKSISGFPLFMNYEYADVDIRDRFAAIKIPSLKVSGMAFPGKPITMETPQGIASVLPKTIRNPLGKSELDYFKITIDGLFPYPWQTPENYYLDELALEGYELTLKLSGPFTISQTGLINGKFTGTVDNLKPLLTQLRDSGSIPKFTVTMVLQFLENIKKNSSMDNLGENEYPIALTVRDNTVYLGMIQIFSF